jgi:hypothetical protein
VRVDVQRLVAAVPDPPIGWLSLAMASTLAGNLTITGSVANIIVAELAVAEGVHGHEVNSVNKKSLDLLSSWPPVRASRPSQRDDSKRRETSAAAGTTP